MSDQVEKSGRKPSDLNAQRVVCFVCVITPFPANESRNNLTFLASAVLLHVCVTAIFSCFPNVQNNESLTGDILLSVLVLVLIFNCSIILLLWVFSQSNLSVKVK